MTRKDTHWRWGEAKERGFRRLIELVTSEPVLHFPTDEGEWRVEADSSDFATGGCLSQEQNGVWVPIAFLSKSLNDTEQNYNIHDKEMLAIMRALYEWQHFLQGSSKKFEIWTDHKNLEYFTTTKKLNRRQDRWSLELSEYDFTLIHKPGKTHGKMDTLSRRGGHNKGVGDNSNITLLPAGLFTEMPGVEFLRAMPAVLDDTPGDALMAEIKQRKDEWEESVKDLWKEGEEDPAGWSQQDGFLTKDNMVYVPDNLPLHHRVMQAHHDTYLAGHPGQYRTAELITRNYWWPSVTKDIRKYVAACPVCQRTKTFPTRPRGPLHPNRVPERIWQYISIDLIVKLPVSNGFDLIVVVIDRLSKGIRVLPCTEHLSGEGIA